MNREPETSQPIFILAMPIRMIAQELYRLIKAVENLEKELKNVPFEKHANINEQLRKAKAERDRLRAILEGKKEHRPKYPGR